MNSVSELGELLRDSALARAAARRPAHVWRAQARMLAAALGRESGEYDASDATPNGHTYSGNVPWLGAATRELGHRQFTEKIGFVESRRRSRKCGVIKRFRVTDRAAAALELLRLQRLLAVHELSFDAGGDQAEHRAAAPSAGKPSAAATA
jgi:hypothetical protein